MAGYTKLFNSILMSTIWREDDKTRIVWITLLAMADKNGVAETSLPSLADAARVSFDDCIKALEKLKSPDEYSRTKDNEGRRITEIEGGFLLLNHGKYREKMSADERRDYNAKKQAEWREKHPVKKVSNNVNDGGDKLPESAMSAHTAPSPSPDAASVNTKGADKPPVRVQFLKPSLEEVKLCAAKTGLPVTEAEKFFNYYESNGWRVGKNPMKSWTHAVANWFKTWREKNPAQAATTAGGRF
jgi:hypothetical protein